MTDLAQEPASITIGANLWNVENYIQITGV